MEFSYIPPIITILLSLVGLIVLIYIFDRMVREPKIGVYLVIITTPFNKSLGSNFFLNRFTISEVAGILLIFAWLLYKTLNKVRIIESREESNTSMLSFALLLPFVDLISILINFAKYTTHKNWIFELSALIYILVFYTLFERIIRTDEDINGAIRIWTATGIVAVIIGLFGAASKFLDFRLPEFMNLTEDRYLWRISGTFRSTGQLGVYLFTTFWIVLALFFKTGISKKQRFLTMLLIFGIAVVSLFTSRRSAIVGFIAGSLVLTLINLRNAKSIKLWFILILSLIFVVLGVLNFNENFANYFSKRLAVIQSDSVGELPPFILSQIGDIIRVFSENPIIGIGLARFHKSEYSSWGAGEIHSTPGQILAETGIIGILVYILFSVTLFKFAYENAFKLNDPKWSQFSVILFAALFGIYTSGLYNRHLRERSFWVLTGIISAINRIGKLKAARKLNYGND